MPGYSWGISAFLCKRGSAQATIVGSICGDCYARAGWYPAPNVKKAQAERLRGLEDPRWVEAMTTALSSEMVRKTGHFRWFDSGDLQDVGHIIKICRIAEATPFLSHWLPTREFGAVVALGRYGVEVPENLCIRVSATMVDAAGIKFWPTTSGAHRHKSPIGFECPAANADEYECGNCRACWDPAVPHISYEWHSSRGDIKQLQLRF